MVTIHIISRSNSETFSRTINPKSEDEFQNEITKLMGEGKEMFGKFYLDFDSMDCTEEQIKWVEEIS